MFDNKIKKKLEGLLSGIDSDKLSQITDMIKNNDDIAKNIDMNKASALLKSLNLGDEVSGDMLKRALDELKKNPGIIDEFKKR